MGLLWFSNLYYVLVMLFFRLKSLPMIILRLPFDWDYLLDLLERFTYDFFRRRCVVEEMALYWLSGQLEVKLKGLLFVHLIKDYHWLNPELKTFLVQSEATELKELSRRLHQCCPPINSSFPSGWAFLEVKGQRTLRIQIQHDDNNTVIFTGQNSL